MVIIIAATLWLLWRTYPQRRREVLGIATWVVGVAVASAAIRFFLAFAPPGFPRADEIHLDAAAMGGALGITTLAMLLFGIAPAFQTSRVDLQQALRLGRAGIGGGSRWMRETLVAGQVALAVLVLSAAGLVARSLLESKQLSPIIALTRPGRRKRPGW